MSAGTLAGVSEAAETTAETTEESDARLWLAEVIWADGRIQYLIAAEDEADAGPPPEFPLTGPPRPIDSYGNR
jgi:hypothetical protein